MHYLFCLIFSCFICYPDAPATAATAQAKAPVRIVTTVFPVHLMVRNVIEGRESVRAELMLPSGMGCPHNYALTPKDMRLLAGADLVIINGLGLEDFLGTPLKQLKPAPQVIDSSADIDPIREDDDHDEEHDPKQNGERGKAKGHEHAQGVNPHGFVSPRQAARMVETIAAGLAQADPAGAALYRANAARYAGELNRLADDLSALAARAVNPRLAASHEVFDYFARDAGLSIVVPIHAHAGVEGSAAAMLSAISHIKGERVAALVVEPRYAERTGKLLSQETGVPLAVLDPMDSGPESAPLDYYLNSMRRNLAALERIFDKQR